MIGPVKGLPGVPVSRSRDGSAIAGMVVRK